MPEQLTRHPEVTLQVLKSAGGAKCAEGAPQTILTTCPAERFCALPGGEICVYGLPDAARMTQIRAADWAALAPAPSAPSAVAMPPALPAPAPPAAQTWGTPALAVALVVGALLGAIAHALLQRRRG